MIDKAALRFKHDPCLQTDSTFISNSFKLDTIYIYIFQALRVRILRLNLQGGRSYLHVAYENGEVEDDERKDSSILGQARARICS